MYSKEEVESIIKDAITHAMCTAKEIIDATEDHALEKPELASAAIGSVVLLKVVRDRILSILGDLQGKVCTSEDEFKFYQSMMGGQRDDS